MAQCALAAYRTVPEDFVLHYLQTNFLGAASRDKELVYKVQRLSTGKRTAVRLVTVEQSRKNIISATISFTKPPSSDSDPVLAHAVPPSTEMGDGVIRLDDFVHLRKADGPFLKGERLPIIPTGRTPSSIAI
jgi:acyl-CoA thioesterase II